MMKKIYLVTGMALLLMTTGAWAQPGGHQHGPGGKGMMQMEQMHKDMDEMRGMMRQMNQETEFKPRYEIMHKHMNTLSKMTGEMGDMPVTKGMPVEQRQDMIEQRMRLLQGMMEQMVGHMHMMHGMGKAADKPQAGDAQ